jgi:hypothetical protein
VYLDDGTHLESAADPLMAHAPLLDLIALLTPGVVAAAIVMRRAAREARYRRRLVDVLAKLDRPRTALARQSA